jgi:predicted Zn-dependent protease
MSALFLGHDMRGSVGFSEQRIDGTAVIGMTQGHGRLYEAAPRVATSVFCRRSSTAGGSIVSSRAFRAPNETNWVVTRAHEESAQVRNILDRLDAQALCITISLFIECSWREYRNSKGNDETTHRVRTAFTLEHSDPRVGSLTDAATDIETLEQKLRLGLSSLSDYEEVIRREGIRAPPKYPVRLLLAPSVAGILCHELFGHGAEENWFGFRPNAQFGPASLNIVAHLPVGRCQDDEGVAACDVPLVDSGRLRNAVRDRSTASEGVSPSGLAQVNSHHGTPRARCTHLRISSGSMPINQVLRAADFGLHCAHVRDAQVEGGVALLHVGRAQLIEGGRLGPAVAPFAIVTSLASFGAQLAAISTCAEMSREACCVKFDDPLPSEFQAPHFLMSDMPVLSI